LVQLLVTNWPRPELNHTVVAFESRDTGSTVDFVVWDPNDPDTPGIVTFDRHAGRFWATRGYDTEPRAIRVVRMYYSRLLGEWLACPWPCQPLAVGGPLCAPPPQA